MFGDAAACAPDVNGDGSTTAADAAALVMLLAIPPTPTPTQTPAPTATPIPPGPAISYFGLAGADGMPLSSLGTEDGVPVFFRNAGSGFKLIVEGRAGIDGVPPGTTVFNTNRSNPALRPDLQIEISAPLGDGSAAVCDTGVPAIDPPDFTVIQRVSDALNDLACNFGVATSSNFACSQDSFGRFAFLGSGTQVQFCLQVSTALAFVTGDTLLTVQLRDSLGAVGPQGQMIIRVNRGAVPGTFTPAATATTAPSSTPTPTPIPTRTLSPTRLPSTTATATRRVTATATPPPTATASPTGRAATNTPTAPFSPTPTATPTRATPSAIASATVTRTSSVTASPRPSATRTPTLRPSATPTATPGADSGPVITFLGLTRADDTLVAPFGTTPGGVPIFVRPSGSGFSLVVEGASGSDRVPVGCASLSGPGCIAYQADLSALPDLQVEVSRALGNGSAQVCDNTGPTAGGVPATNPPNFDATPLNIATVNDLGCRFLNGTGSPGPRLSSQDSCVATSDVSGFAFANPASRIQYCGFITRVLQFPPGDTLVTVKLRNRTGNVGPSGQMLVRIEPPTPPPS